MNFTPEQVIDALKKVKHPSRNEDIVSLKMVQEVRVDGNDIFFTLVFERPNDPFISSLKKACVKAVEAQLGTKAKVRNNITVRAQQVKEAQQMLQGVKNIIAIASGKGGVGKSTVACNIAVAAAAKGYKVGLIDADVYGPSIPKMLNTEGSNPLVVRREGQDMIQPVENYQVKLLSIGYFIEPSDPVVWRGPMATSALKQFLGQTDWGALDFLFIDLPPGTSDIHLTMVQEVPVTGVVIITTPQNVALADALKGVNMFRGDKINVPVLGLIENMSWFTPAELPENRYYIFGRDGGQQLAGRLGIPLLGQIPLVLGVCEDCDTGNPSVLNEQSPVRQIFLDVTDRLISEIHKRNIEKAPTKKVEIGNK
jgi:ATP-binding protein involved in chromosome partitioning